MAPAASLHIEMYFIHCVDGWMVLSENTSKDFGTTGTSAWARSETHMSSVQNSVG